MASRPGIYLCVVLIVCAATGAYGFRTSSLFACQPIDDPSASYLAYCESTGYADYDYGAFWFDLEPGAVSAAAGADVLFLGNSRVQFGLSTESTADWFTSAKSTYYLLGFAYDGNYRFAAPLLSELRPAARVYIVNVDLFFEPEPTPPAKTVMYRPSSEARYRQKRQLQRAHFFVCSKVHALCGQSAAIYRSRDTGIWRVSGGPFTSAPVSYDRRPADDVVREYVAAAREFLQTLSVPAECQILTVIPTVNTPLATAEEIAKSLDRSFIAPALDELQTYDGSHLDTTSANRWSSAFLAGASAQIHRCLDGAPKTTVPSGN